MKTRVGEVERVITDNGSGRDALHLALDELLYWDGLREVDNSYMRAEWQHTLSIFLARKAFWRTLKLAMNSYSCLAFILTRTIGISPISRGSRLAQLPTCNPEGRVGGGLTIDRVYNLAVGGSCATLFDLGVVDLEELVEPGNELCARLSHREDA